MTPEHLRNLFLPGMWKRAKAVGASPMDWEIEVAGDEVIFWATDNNVRRVKRVNVVTDKDPVHTGRAAILEVFPVEEKGAQA